jgi:hypothetical protein
MSKITTPITSILDQLLIDRYGAAMQASVAPKVAAKM